MSVLPEPTLEEAVQATLGQKYKNIKFYKQGGTKKIFLSTWNPAPDICEQRIIKVNDVPITPRAQRHVERNYNTLHEAKMLLSLKEPEKHHLARVYDIEPFEESILTVESYFAAETLEERVARAGPLTSEQFKKVFTQVIEGMQYMMNENDMLHRDLKPSNILVDENYTVRIIDFSNAQRRTELAPKPLPTAGGHLVMDPLLIGEFTGKEAAYNDQSEMFALGTTMLYALTGKYAAEYDPDEKQAFAVSNHTSLLKDGRLDATTHNNVIAAALTQIDTGYEYIIRSTTSLSNKQRYKTINALAKAFRKASNPGLLERMGRACTQSVFAGVMSTVLFASAVGTAGITYFNYMQERNIRQIIAEEKRIEDAKYQLNAKWSGSTGEITNNVVQMDMIAMIPAHYKSVDRDHPEPYYPEIKYLHGKPGEEISITVMAKDLPRPTAYESLNFEGKVYIEGFNGEKFTVHSTSGDDTDMWGCGPCGSWGGYTHLNIPKGIKNGTYVLAAEMYAPKQQIFDTVHVPEGRIISRKRIPIIVGDEKQAIDLDSIGVGFMKNRIYIDNPKDMFQDTDPNVTYKASLPEENTELDAEAPQLGSNNIMLPLYLPKRPEGTQRILRISAEKDGKAIWQTFFPVESVKINEDIYEWKLTTSDRSFSEKTVQYSTLDKPSR